MHPSIAFITASYGLYMKFLLLLLMRWDGGMDGMIQILISLFQVSYQRREVSLTSTHHSYLNDYVFGHLVGSVKRPIRKWNSEKRARKQQGENKN